MSATVTLTLFARAMTETEWSRLNVITLPEPQAQREIERLRDGWAHTLLPDHDFCVTDGAHARWPAPLSFAPAEPTEPVTMDD